MSCTVRVRLTERNLDSLQEADSYIGGRNYKGIDKDKMGNRRFNLQRLGRMPSVWQWPADKIIHVPHGHHTYTVHPSQDSQ